MFCSVTTYKCAMCDVHSQFWDYVPYFFSAKRGVHHFSHPTHCTDLITYVAILGWKRADYIEKLLDVYTLQLCIVISQVPFIHKLRYLRITSPQFYKMRMKDSTEFFLMQNTKFVWCTEFVQCTEQSKVTQLVQGTEFVQ